MKYKLINTKTNEEHLCDKVTIDGFEYYANDNNVDLNDWVTNGLQIAQVNVLTVNDPNKHLHKKVIATTNPNIDIPKVVDEVERLAWEHTDKKYIDVDDDSPSTELNIWNANYLGFQEGYNKSQETHPFSKEDMIDLLNFVAQKMISLTNFRMNDKIWASDVRDKKLYSSKEIIQLWKEQKTKIVYYE